MGARPTPPWGGGWPTKREAAGVGPPPLHPAPPPFPQVGRCPVVTHVAGIQGHKDGWSFRHGAQTCWTGHRAYGWNLRASFRQHD